MKNIKSNTLNNRSVIIFGLQLVAFLYLTSFNYLISSSENKKVVHPNFPSDYQPDTIPDTIPAIAVYNVSDTADIYLDGLDSIILLQEDTTIYSAQTNSIEIYYLGESNNEVDFNKPADTIAYFYVTDSAAFFIPANDSIVFNLLKVDSSEYDPGSEKIGVEIRRNMDEFVIKPGNAPRVINMGIFGIHTPGIFDPNHLNAEEDVNFQEGWDALRDLKPTSLRWPGGADTRFMHPYDYDKNWDGIADHTDGSPDRIKGYGYDINQIIRFLDVTEDQDVDDASYDPLTDPYNNIQVDNPFSPTEITTAEIIDDMEDLTDYPGETVANPTYVCNLCVNWMNPDYIENFTTLYKKYIDQTNLPDNSERYIDQFIDLVNEIEAFWHISTDGHIADPDYKIDVIVDLSIPCMSATECWNQVQHLLDGGVKVVGVEMGNEVFYDWATDWMGFHEFRDYYNYIQGYGPNLASYSTTDDIISDAAEKWNSTYYSYVYGPHGEVLPDEDCDQVDCDHDYVSMFKLNEEFSCKIGIPGNIQSTSDGFPPDCGECPECKTIPDWPSDLQAAYTDQFPGGQYKFDAVVLHPYYAPGSNTWRGIPLDHLCESYPTVGIDDCTPKSCEYESDKWNPTSYDERLRPAFDGMMGYDDVVTSAPLTGNINTLLKQKYRQGYDCINLTYEFNLNSAEKKELWETEWNLKDKITDPNDVYSDDQERLFTIYNNTFIHGYLTMEWALKNLKLNYQQPDFFENFFTFADFHSYAGGGWSEMLVQADCADKFNLVITSSQPYYTKRTVYFSFELLSKIWKQKLQYLPSTSGLVHININQPPTVFIDPARKYLYIYFSNVKDYEQYINLNPGLLTSFFPGAVAVKFGILPTEHVVNVSSPDAGSGRSNLFSAQYAGINSCYGCNNADYPGDYHPTTITGINHISPIIDPVNCSSLLSGGICLPELPYSFGYFKVAIIPIYPTDPGGGGELKQGQINDEDINIYPNPAYDNFTLEIENFSESPEDGKFHVTILDMLGNPKANFLVNAYDEINISQLMPGMYMVSVLLPNKQKITKPIIKLN